MFKRCFRKFDAGRPGRDEFAGVGVDGAVGDGIGGGIGVCADLASGIVADASDHSARGLVTVVAVGERTIVAVVSTVVVCGLVLSPLGSGGSTVGGGPGLEGVDGGADVLGEIVDELTENLVLPVWVREGVLGNICGPVVQVGEVINFRRDVVRGIVLQPLRSVAYSLDFRFRRDVASVCLLYTSPSPRDQRGSRMPSSA